MKLNRSLLFLLAMASMMLTACVTHQDRQYGYVDYGNAGYQQTYINQPPIPQNGSTGSYIPTQGTQYPNNQQMYAVQQPNTGRVTYENNSEGFSMQDIYPAIALALSAADMILHYDSLQRIPNRHYYSPRPYYRW